MHRITPSFCATQINRTDAFSYVQMQRRQRCVPSVSTKGVELVTLAPMLYTLTESVCVCSVLVNKAVHVALYVRLGVLRASVMGLLC